MGQVEETLVIDASLAEVWELYFEPRSWPAWVDGFARTDALDGYPLENGTLRWQSVPAGRGTVTETVTEHDPRRSHRVRWEDPQSTGELATTFAIEPGEKRGTRVAQKLDYALRSGGVFARLTDVLFVRAQMRRSLQRSLLRFKGEAEARAATRR